MTSFSNEIYKPPILIYRIFDNIEIVTETKQH